MAQLFIEFLSEEIPALMHRRAREDLKRHADALLREQGMVASTIHTYSTPRRLVLVAEDLPLQQPDLRQEKKGPRVDGPAAALEGFFKTNQVTAADCVIQETPKGRFYILEKTIEGRPLREVAPLIVHGIIERFSWPKSMAWGTSSRMWVRPLQSGLCFIDKDRVDFTVSFGPEGELAEKRVAFGSTTVGHRLLSPKRFEVTDFNDYQQKLRQHHVILDHRERESMIMDQITQALKALGDVEIVSDPQLLEEVVGLVEWPVVLTGRIEDAFMILPPELLMTTMRVHQRYFATKDKSGVMTPYFLLVSNQSAPDGGKAIVHGNQRVLRARLNDARFFYGLDQKTPLVEQALKLQNIVFYQKLGTLADKTKRMTALAGVIAPFFKVDVKDAGLAASLAKADLVSEMVREFPELQGIMGKYYAKEEGLDPAVALAIEGHYRPKGAEDVVPTDALSQVVGLADRLDSLVGFFAIGVKPTGSKDPFALRRAILGIIRILEDNRDVRLYDLFRSAYDQYSALFQHEKTTPLKKEDVLEELKTFLVERLRVFFKDSGIRHDYFNAAIQVGSNDPLGVLKARVQSIKEFLDGQSSDGQNLLTAYRRASNMLRIEEKKENRAFLGTVRPEHFIEAEEKNLFTQLNAVRADVEPALKTYQFDQAMQKLSTLRPVVDAYFDKVTVNHETPSVRENRLETLALLRQSLDAIVDFSRVEEA
ncbi:MAG: glycine--tRNA ligase subunit beta [Candidatus Nucleicultricaceae bacterium]